MRNERRRILSGGSASCSGFAKSLVQMMLIHISTDSSSIEVQYSQNTSAVELLRQIIIY